MHLFGERPTFSVVMRGLDPRIHRSSKEGFLGKWIAGSSPAMTNFS
jgi:hypothetical protein